MDHCLVGQVDTVFAVSHNFNFLHDAWKLREEADEGLRDPRFKWGRRARVLILWGYVPKARTVLPMPWWKHRRKKTSFE